MSVRSVLVCRSGYVFKRELIPEETAFSTLSCLDDLCLMYLSSSLRGLGEAGPCPGKSIGGARSRILLRPDMYASMSPSEDGTRIVPTTTQLSPLTTPASPTRQMCPGQWPDVSITSQVLTPEGPFSSIVAPSSSFETSTSAEIAPSVSSLAQIGAW